MKRIFRWILKAVPFVLIPICTLWACLIGWVFRTWPHLKLEELRYEIQAPLKGTGGGLITSALLSCAVPALVVLAALIVLSRVLHSKKPRWVPRTFAVLSLLAILAFGLATFTAADRLDLAEYRSMMAKNHSYIEDHYVYPDSVEITFPEKKRNLIYIFLESMETTYADTAAGGVFEKNRIPELTALALENEDFSGKDAVLNGAYTPFSTTWTMAAMFAHSSGLPLKIDIPIHEMYKQEHFFPSMVNLGDILEREGYQQSLLIGSEGAFGGRALYYGEHGNYNMLDYDHMIANGILPADYHVWWGFEDEKLFGFAKDELLRLSAQDAPFNLTLLTVDTHFEDGHICPLCPTEFDDQYSNVLACSSRQVADFVQWVSQQDFYEDTAIVIAGDHLTMDADYLVHLDETYDRKVYTAFINAAAECETDKSRVYSSFDLFPTTLSAMGVQIEGDRLALGTDLFSATPTLLEEDGLATLDYELKHRSLFMEHMASLQLKTAQGSVAFSRHGEAGKLAVKVSDVYDMAHAVEAVTLKLTDASGKLREFTLAQQPDRSYTAVVDLSSFERGMASYRLDVQASGEVSYQLKSGKGALTLCEQPDIDAYLDELLRLEDASIFIVSWGDVSRVFTPSVCEKLNRLGIRSDLAQIGDQGILAALTPDGVQEQLSASTLTLRGELPNSAPFMLVSNGDTSAHNAGCQIYIDSRNYAPVKEGLHFVVCDNQSGQVMDASLFNDASWPRSAVLSAETANGKAAVTLHSIQTDLAVKEYQLWYWDSASIAMPHSVIMTAAEDGTWRTEIDISALEQKSLHMAAYALCAPDNMHDGKEAVHKDRLLRMAQWQP